MSAWSWHKPIAASAAASASWRRVRNSPAEKIPMSRPHSSRCCATKASWSISEPRFLVFGAGPDRLSASKCAHRQAIRPSKGAISWSRPDALPIQTGLGSTWPVSRSTTADISRSMIGSRPAHPVSGRSARPLVVHSSPMSRSTISVSSPPI